jgi:hypothetical protein
MFCRPPLPEKVSTCSAAEILCGCDEFLRLPEDHRAPAVFIPKSEAEMIALFGKTL